MSSLVSPFNLLNFLSSEFVLHHDSGMNTLLFTHQHRRSTKTHRLNYGFEGMKYIIRVYEGEINGHGEKEGLPTEYQYEFEQEKLKHVHDLRMIWEKGWEEREYPEVSQTSFLRSENSGAELGFKFDWISIQLSFILVTFFGYNNWFKPETRISIIFVYGKDCVEYNHLVEYLSFNLN